MAMCKISVNVKNFSSPDKPVRGWEEQMPQTNRFVGHIKRIGREYGFISSERMGDAYFSVEDIIGGAILNVGDSVSFECYRNARGYVAKRIRLDEPASRGRHAVQNEHSHREPRTSVDDFIDAYNAYKLSRGNERASENCFSGRSWNEQGTEFKQMEKPCRMSDCHQWLRQKGYVERSDAACVECEFDGPMHDYLRRCGEEASEE